MMRTQLIKRVLLGTVMAGALLAMQPARAADDAVFQAFGGKEGMARVVDDFLVEVQKDPRIAMFFTPTSIPRLKVQLTEQFCQLTGGPCVYQGADMKSSHANMGLTHAHFNALAEDLQIAMTRAGVPNAAQNKLLAKLAPMQRDIVTR
ncbi:group I truncated hemoglobin [Aquabacterium fontiphilum]|uniref:group I truncated hemoglobin n=1 Tax=Aquabacterium fontiphilum TaxID=450365 RepID=UPI001F2262C7|nr:group 1 truncated hemoglobin [Aquabacterium fontiphilum]